MASAEQSALASASENDRDQEQPMKTIGTTGQDLHATAGARSGQGAASSSRERATSRGGDEQVHPTIRRGDMESSSAQGDAPGSSGSREAAVSGQPPEDEAVENPQEHQGEVRSSPGRRSDEQLAEEELKPGPVFVPIVLCMDDVDHELLVREWHACHAVSRPAHASVCCCVVAWHHDVWLWHCSLLWYSRRHIAITARFSQVCCKCIACQSCLTCSTTSCVSCMRLIGSAEARQ